MPPVKTAEVESKDQLSPTVDRVVGMLYAQYYKHILDPLGQKMAVLATAARGETIKVTPAEEARLDGIGALLPEGEDPAQAAAIQAAHLDAYRGARGDTEANARHQQRLLETPSPSGAAGGIVRSDAPVESGAGALSTWIKTQQPTAEETVALADGNADIAAVVLEAETAATDGSPRPEVVEGLKRIG
jgi:hypothetical protein